MPHLHVEYQGQKASISIPDGNLLEGDLPAKKLRMVQAWIAIHEEELMADWTLAERLNNPRVPASALAGMPDRYKIKLLRVGYRLEYRVEDETVFVTVIAVGKREKLKVYDTAKSRL